MHIPGIKYNHSCFLCSIGSEYLIKSTGEYIVKVNPHPFNNGHVVVISNEHKPLGEVTPLELFSMLKEAASLMRHLRHIYNPPQGFNVGIVNKPPHAAIHVVLDGMVTPASWRSCSMQSRFQSCPRRLGIIY